MNTIHRRNTFVGTADQTIGLAGKNIKPRAFSALSQRKEDNMDATSIITADIPASTKLPSSNPKKGAGWLVLSRYKDESVRIGDDIEVMVVAVRGDSVRLIFSAPRDVEIWRSELYEEVAASPNPKKGVGRLVLSRRIDESVRIGDDIEVMVSAVKGGRVRLGVTAPSDVRIMRTELL